MRVGEKKTRRRGIGWLGKWAASRRKCTWSTWMADASETTSLHICVLTSNFNPFGMGMIPVTFGGFHVPPRLKACWLRGQNVLFQSAVSYSEPTFFSHEPPQCPLGGNSIPFSTGLSRSSVSDVSEGGPIPVQSDVSNNALAERCRRG